MNKEQLKWYSISLESRALRCAYCNNEFYFNSPFLDHHPSECPACGVECAFLDWKGRKIQIVMKNAPQPLLELIEWTQNNLDELEYVELMSSIEKLADEFSSLTK